jgi:sugar lactone lactonase YvrE
VFNDSNKPKGVEIVARGQAIQQQGLATPADVTVYYPTRGSVVFAAGSLHWAWGLARPGYADARVQRMLENVFARAGVAPTRFTRVGSSVPTLTASASGGAHLHTVAGSSDPGYRDGPGQQALFNAPAGLAAASDGTIFVTDQRNHLIREIRPDGNVSTLAGCGPSDSTEGSYLAGAGTTACFSAPSGIAVGAHDVIYVSDTGNHCIRTITRDGAVSVFAGTCTTTGKTDSTTATKALFSSPRGIALGPSGELYVADSGNSVLRRIDAHGVTTVAGAVPNVCAVAVAPDGTLYAMSDTTGSLYAVRAGVVSVLANTSKSFGDRDGPAATAQLRPSDGLVIAGDQLIFSDSANYKLRALALASSQVLTLVSGTAPAQRWLHLPRGLALTADALLIADTGQNRIVSVPRSTLHPVKESPDDPTVSSSVVPALAQ